MIKNTQTTMKVSEEKWIRIFGERKIKINYMAENSYKMGIKALAECNELRKNQKRYK